MKALFLSKTIKARILRYNFCIICVIAVIFSVSSYATANKKTVEISQNSLIFHVESISFRYIKAYEEMLNIVLSCTERSSFNLSQMGSLGTPEEKRAGIEYAKLVANYCAITGYDDYIRRLSIFNNKGMMVQSGAALSSTDDSKRILATEWFDAELVKPTERYRLDLRAPIFYNETEQMLPIIREISGSKQVSWAGIFISPKLFQDELVKNDNGNEIIVFTHTGTRVASLHEPQEHVAENDALIAEILGQDKHQDFVITTIHGRSSMLAYETYSRSGITVMEILDLNTLKNDRIMMLQTVILIFIMCLCLGLILSFVFSNQVRKPINHLVLHINRIAGGDFSQDQTLESEDEIGQIGKVVNTMAGQIGQLMQQRLDDEKEKSSLELKMLQAQINPHFLYNTLDSIKWIAVIQKNSGIVKVVTALSGLLKNMAKGFHEKVTIAKELEFVNDYITIEKIKYAELFDVQITVEDPDLYRAGIVKLTLQPLVENAIFSGIEPSGKNGMIQIMVYARDNLLYLRVRDDGVGIPPDKMENLLKDTERVKGSRMSSIGIANVDRRIKLTYGEEFGLTVTSELGRYTEIIIKMPLEFVDEGGTDYV